MSELYIGTACTSSRSYYIVPKEEIRVNLELVSEKLEKIGWKITKKSKGILIASKNRTIAIFPSGKILIRDTVDEDIAKKIAEEVFPIIIESRVNQ